MRNTVVMLVAIGLAALCGCEGKPEATKPAASAEPAPARPAPAATGAAAAPAATAKPEATGGW